MAVEIGMTFSQAADHSPGQLLLLSSAVTRKRGRDMNEFMRAYGAFKSRPADHRAVCNDVKRMMEDYGGQDS